MTWTERYLDPGEFKLVADLSSGLDTFLPLGTIVSHTDTYELMIVENQLVKEEADKSPIVEITGRSLETILEQRIIGARQVDAPGDNLLNNVTAAESNPLQQAYNLLVSEITTSSPERNLPLIEVVMDANGFIPTISEARKYRKGNVHQQLMELLGMDNLGISCVKANNFGVIGRPDKTQFRLYSGANRTGYALFSGIGGDFKSVDILESNKQNKNVAVVTSTYFEVSVALPGPVPSNLDRREIFVDASDIDGDFDQAPTDANTKNLILDYMRARGRAAIRRNNSFVLSRTDTAEFTHPNFRKDYHLGDLVTVESNFAHQSVMRVTEYTEITDENGTTGHPTFGSIF
jgi:hypothetical protein